MENPLLHLPFIFFCRPWKPASPGPQLSAFGHTLNFSPRIAHLRTVIPNTRMGLSELHLALP